jgi:DNA-binding NarL/FixJ family response regulator
MPERSNQKWTAEEERQLQELANRGMTLQQIALRLRRSKGPVKKHAKELGLTLRAPFRLNSIQQGSTWKQRTA